MNRNSNEKNITTGDFITTYAVNASYSEAEELNNLLVTSVGSARMDVIIQESPGIFESTWHVFKSLPARNLNSEDC